jgi:DNA repair protein RadA/Sms
MTQFFCKECGYESTKWIGKCPACQSWNSFKEVKEFNASKDTHPQGMFFDGNENQESKLELLKDIEYSDDTRVKIGINEFDGVLGGGIVSGMVVLIGGEPGIGKSTLMLQVANKLSVSGKKVLYVSGEESRHQIKLRSSRMNIQSESLYLFCSNQSERMIEAIKMSQPDLVIVDSIQSIGCNHQTGIPGSISQVREVTTILTRIAKQSNIPVFIIGHITKEGTVAGPKLIEHLVDTVLYFEGDVSNQLKILKTTKNRFGSTNEIGVFEMTGKGLIEMANPSSIFIQDKLLATGAAIGCVLEGTRSFLVEVQALASPSVYGTAQRIAMGFDQKKMALLLAIIEKHLALNLRQNDIFVNIVGGLKINEPAIDLAIVAAIISTYENKPLRSNTVYIGEVGLNGEIRPVSMTEKRVKEAVKLGYESIVIADKSNSTNLSQTGIQFCQTLTEIYPLLFD